MNEGRSVGRGRLFLRAVNSILAAMTRDLSVPEPRICFLYRESLSQLNVFVWIVRFAACWQEGSIVLLTSYAQFRMVLSIS